MMRAALADEPKVADPVVTAADLQAAFNANIIAAEKKYATGKPIRVTGLAGPIKKDKDGSYSLTVGGMNARLSKEGEKVAADLLPGRKVIVTGTLAVTTGGSSTRLEMKGCAMEILPEEKKAEVKKDPKEPDPLEKPFTEYVTVKCYHAMIVPEGGGKPAPGFSKPKENVQAYRSVDKDGIQHFVVRIHNQNSPLQQVSPRSEIIDKEGVVWVVTKSSAGQNRYFLDVQKKP